MTKYLFCLILCWGASINFCLAQAILYPQPVGIKPSAAYAVQVDGKAAFVYDVPVPASYCSFDMKGPVHITIKANRDIKWVDVRPFSAQVKATFKDSTIHLQLTRPVKLSIELNGSIKNPLFLFANAPEHAKPKKTDPGIRFFEGGKVHYAGLIELKSNESVYIEGGAVVVGAIKARAAKNIKVYGHGILDGTYNKNLDTSVFNGLQTDTALLRNMKGKYTQLLQFIDCENVSVEGITQHNNTTWQVVPINCDKVVIRNIKIISDQNSDDGIDIVRSRNVRIEDCFIRTKDDCIAIKAHLDYPEAAAVDDILVRNCVFWNALWGNGIEIGFELNAAEIKNIRFINNDIIHVEAGAAISIHNAGSGHVKNILFENIRIEDARQKLFDFAIFRSSYSKDGTENQEEIRRQYLNGAWDGVLQVPDSLKGYHATFRGQVSDVVLKDIQVLDGLFPYSLFYGFDAAHPIQRVRIENLQVHGKPIRTLADARLYLENTAKISIK